jgi:hypothetical protein
VPPRHKVTKVLESERKFKDLIRALVAKLMFSTALLELISKTHVIPESFYRESRLEHIRRMAMSGFPLKTCGNDNGERGAIFEITSILLLSPLTKIPSATYH